MYTKINTNTNVYKNKNKYECIKNKYKNEYKLIPKEVQIQMQRWKTNVSGRGS